MVSESELKSQALTGSPADMRHPENACIEVLTEGLLRRFCGDWQLVVFVLHEDVPARNVRADNAGIDTSNATHRKA